LVLTPVSRPSQPISPRAAFTRTYLAIDARSLGLFRIGLAALLLVDLAARARDLRDFYTNAGLVPNHTMLWRPQAERLFSVFLPASLGAEVWLIFALCAACYLALLVGWRTRVFQVACFLLATSLHNRVLFVEGWAGPAMASLMLWTLFLPLGRRFSVDALRASLRARPDERPGDLTPERLPPPDDRPAVSLACLGVLLQLAAILWCDRADQTGTTWRDGTALHYLLWQARLVTATGAWARAGLSAGTLAALTHALRAVELVVPILVLAPVLRHWTRGLAIVALVGLHVGLALLVKLGGFAGAMIAFAPLLLTDAHWRWLARAVPTRGRRRTVYYDASCGVCFQIVRTLARLDAHRRLTWVSNQDTSALPKDVPPDLLERTMLVIDLSGLPARDRRWTRSDAFAQIFAALPFGRLGAWVLLVPGLRAVALAAYDAFARNRTTISTSFGLAACGIPGAPPPPRAPAPTETPLAAWTRARLPLLRELGAAFVLFALAADLSATDPSLPAALRWDDRPAWAAAVVSYPHAVQRWGLFADVPTRDSMVVIDAVTRAGRHVDPLNERGLRAPTPPVDDVPPRLPLDALWSNYELRIPTMSAYYQALLEWVNHYPDRTGRPDDAIVSFDAWVVEHASPRPGETAPSDVSRRLFIRWKQPASPKP
jgi:predicted DCC family thiol-disulfide oxidoreductase YuxK